MGALGLDSLGLLILRLFVGLAFLVHGYGKLGKVPLFASKFNLSPLVAVLVVYAQLIGGAMLMLGVLTPAASLAVGATMVGAIMKCRGRGERFIDPEHHSWESAGFYLMVSIVIVLLGPGKYSLDAILFG